MFSEYASSDADCARTALNGRHKKLASVNWGPANLAPVESGPAWAAHIIAQARDAVVEVGQELCVASHIEYSTEAPNSFPFPTERSNPRINRRYDTHVHRVRYCRRSDNLDHLCTYAESGAGS